MVGLFRIIMSPSIVVTFWLLLSLDNSVHGFSHPAPRSVIPTPTPVLHNESWDEGKTTTTATTGTVTRRQVMTTSVVTAAAVVTLLFGTTDMAAAIETTGTTTLDFSLPRYDTKMQGFGEGTEAYTSKIGTSNTSSSSSSNNNNNLLLMTDPGANEKDKQLRSMQLAEEARQAALAKKRADAKLRDEETRRRAAEKQAKNADRFASIFN
jgi:hypothetical protein